MAKHSLGGRPATYGEKKKSYHVSLTDTGREGLDKLSIQFGLSRSEFLERLGRGSITVHELQTIYRNFVNGG